MTRILAAFVAAVFSTNAFAAEPNMTLKDPPPADSWIAPQSEEELCSAMAECADYMQMQARLAKLEEQRKLLGHGTPRLNAAEDAIKGMQRDFDEMRQQLQTAPPPAAPAAPATDAGLVQLENDIRQLQSDVAALTDRVAALEKKVDDHEKQIAKLEARGIPLAFIIGVGAADLHQHPFSGVAEWMIAGQIETGVRLGLPADGLFTDLTGFYLSGTGLAAGAGGKLVIGTGIAKVVEVGGLLGGHYYGLRQAKRSPYFSANFYGGEIGAHAGLNFSVVNLSGNAWVTPGRAEIPSKSVTALPVGASLNLRIIIPLGHLPARKDEPAAEQQPQNSDQPAEEQTPAADAQAPALGDQGTTVTPVPEQQEPVIVTVPAPQ